MRQSRMIVRALAECVAPLPSQTAWGRNRPHRPAPVTCLAQVSLGQEARLGPVNVIAWREHDDDGAVALHAATPHLPATAQTTAAGKRRMGIETVLRDWQRGGLHLDACGLTHTDRAVRLLLVLAIAYLWLVSLGRWGVKRGCRRMIDDGSARHWHCSLFQLGVGWKERLASDTLPLPVLFHVSVSY